VLILLQERFSVRSALDPSDLSFLTLRAAAAGDRSGDDPHGHRTLTTVRAASRVTALPGAWRRVL
jgi:hypothetical protein